jgi:hypothetical protein
MVLYRWKDRYDPVSLYVAQYSFEFPGIQGATFSLHWMVYYMTFMVAGEHIPGEGQVEQQIPDLLTPIEILQLRDELRNRPEDQHTRIVREFVLQRSELVPEDEEPVELNEVRRRH